MAPKKKPAGPIRLIRRWWSRRYYNRLLFLSAVIFVLVIFSFGGYAAILVTKLDTNNQLQKGRDILASVCDEYDRKHDNFYNIILPFYNSSENYTILSSIFDADQQDLVNSALFKQRVVTMLKALCLQDRDIVAVLMHCNSTGKDYLYNDLQNSFGPPPKGFPFFDKLKTKPAYNRAVYGVSTWGSAGRQRSTYGIATGSVGTKSIYGNAGSILIAYDVSGLVRVFQKFQSPETARYFIVSKDGGVIFDSAGAMYGQPFPYMELLGSLSSTVSLDGIKYFLQTADHSNRQYYGIYLESDMALSEQIRRDQFVIFGICTGVSVISAMLYGLAGLISSHRIRELDHAMSHIGSNNLSYRIPLRGSEDEFEHIAARFNRMCDELQDNVNRIYLYGIRQKNAELSALQSGIHPHFLYNTLEAIRSRATEDGNDDVAELIVMMSSLLRILVRSQMFVPIRQEIHFIRIYLDLLALRHADRFQYAIDVDEAVLDFYVPKGILQPVVENYFVHGIREDTDDNFLSIHGGMQGDHVVFDIQDNGKGIEPRRLEELRARLQSMEVSRSSYGLANVHERIRLVYGAGCGIALENREQGARILVTIGALTAEQLPHFESTAQKA